MTTRTQRRVAIVVGLLASLLAGVVCGAPAWGSARDQRARLHALRDGTSARVTVRVGSLCSQSTVTLRQARQSLVYP